MTYFLPKEFGRVYSTINLPRLGVNHTLIHSRFYIRAWHDFRARGCCRLGIFSLDEGLRCMLLSGDTAGVGECEDFQVAGI